MTNDPRERFWNIFYIVEELEEQPHTYTTILQECKDDNTCQLIVRRKLNKLLKEGVVCKTNIPGTRFGKCIFYKLPKKYFLLVESTRTGSAVYYFFEYKYVSKFFINVKECWELNGCSWIKRYNKTFSEGSTLKFI